MLPEGKALTGILLLQAAIQEPSPGFHKKQLMTQVAGTFSKPSPLQRDFPNWEEFNLQVKKRKLLHELC